MKHNLSLLCICCIFQQHIHAQTNSSQNLVRCTTGISGSTVEITSTNKTYVIQQSIGQASTIGTFNNNNYTLRQGFIQPNILAKIIDEKSPLNLQVKIYPNPFVEYITLSFKDEIKGDIKVALYDLLGRIIDTKSYLSNQLITVKLNKLPSAEYILKVHANRKQFITKIIKE
ncbi:MAG: T9SS type A sorting domain-containing protein [Flavobacteriaceae bacterium]|nr:T9SS type A sorting domain-containing protein [Flavobacteriaceae bacterium]